MLWLCLGVLLWAFAHFLTTLFRPQRQALIEKLGETRYKIGFSVAIVLSVVLIVIGWQSVGANYVYAPPGYAWPLGAILMIIAIILFGAGRRPTLIKQYLRHPQLTGVAVWSFAHLLMNGNSRDIVLFGGLGLWALVQMPLINARDGEWVKPEPPSMARELRGLAITAVIFVVILLLHPYLFGVVPVLRT